MFGYRSDGRKLKTLPPFFKVIPNIMLERNDSQVLFKQDISIKNLDEYIDKNNCFYHIIRKRRKNKYMVKTCEICSIK